MSGGHFDYVQYRLNDIVVEINKLIENNNIKDEWGYCNNFSEKTLKEFGKAISCIKKAEIYIQRIDWLVSGDDGEENFQERLADDLKNSNLL